MATFLLRMYAPSSSGGTPANSNTQAHETFVLDESALRATSQPYFWTDDGRDDFNRVFLSNCFTAACSLFPSVATEDIDTPIAPFESPRARQNSTLDQPQTPVDELQNTLTHRSIGVHDGKHTCACGKAYKRPSGLENHLANDPDYRPVCPVCSKTFARRYTCRRHVEDQHGNGKATCPNCPRRSRRDYLKLHSKNGRCKGIAEHVEDCLMPDIGEAQAEGTVERYANAGVGLQLGHTEPVDTLGSEGSHSLFAGNASEVTTTQMPSFNLPIISAIFREPCELCGKKFNQGRKEVEEHAFQHQAEFASARYKCEACNIPFKFEKDLEMHLAAASKGHCGFTFSHNHNESPCTGHHPPPPPCRTSGVLRSNHKLMEQMLMHWETFQIRRMRESLSLHMMERNEHPRDVRLSGPAKGLDAVASMQRPSGESVRTYRSVPSWLIYQNSITNTGPEEMDISDADFEALHPSVDTWGNADANEGMARPDSPLLGTFGHL